ncbi:MAG: Uma2 family endonuclease [Cytophagales bacterium]|jgi:Uma2 family endonuclease|nr:Uma2 family endonuclease [Cytophagales bacterium]
METLELISDYELERGKPKPSLNHSVTQSHLLVEMSLRYRKTYTILSELSLEMPEKPDTVPDIAIYAKLEIDFLHDRTTVAEMPLTIIEIVSPSQSNDDILAKFERYFKAGVKSCWLVMPSFKAISVYSDIGVYTFFKHSDTLTDPAVSIELPLAEIFG